MPGYELMHHASKLQEQSRQSGTSSTCAFAMSLIQAAQRPQTQHVATDGFSYNYASPNPMALRHLYRLSSETLGGP